MKTLAQVLRLTLAGVVIVALNFGCATTGSTSSGGHGLTLKQTSDQVENAMLRYRNESIAGALTDAQREGIQNAYKQYKAIFSDALVKAGSNMNSATPANLQAAAENVVARVAAIP